MRFTSCFSKVYKQHVPLVLSMASFFSNAISSSSCLLHVTFGSPHPLLLTTSKPNALLNTSPLFLFKACPYHRIPFALTNLCKNFSKTYLKSHYYFQDQPRPSAKVKLHIMHQEFITINELRQAVPRYAMANIEFTRVNFVRFLGIFHSPHCPYC